MDERDFRVPLDGPAPVPAPEHQRKISRNKWFEVVTVIAMIAVGAGYLTWRNSGGARSAGPSATLSETAAIVEAALQPNGGSRYGSGSGIFGRTLVALSQPLGMFECRVELFGASPDAPLESAIISLRPDPAKWRPPGEDLLDAVNGVGELGQKIVASSGEALDKAVKTSEFIDGVPRPHDKGVAATDDGWKITYVTYRGFDENANPPQPVLYYVLQRISAGEDQSLGPFNRALYEAIHSGADALQAVRAASAQ